MWFVDGSGARSQFRTLIWNWSPIGWLSSRGIMERLERITNVSSYLYFRPSLAWKLAPVVSRCTEPDFDNSSDLLRALRIPSVETLPSAQRHVRKATV